MLSYPYINELFTNILTADSLIKGRFHMAPNGPNDLNDIDLNDILARAAIPSIKLPLCLMPPAVCAPSYKSGGRQRDAYNVFLLFLTGTYMASGGNVKKPAGDGRSTHTIPQDWHDMKRCADEFMLVLLRLIEETALGQYFSIVDDGNQLITPVSQAGNDGLSGVCLQFRCAINSAACELEQYTDEGIAGISIPTTDSHPSHLQ